jgi:hypothetical protein
MAMSRGDLATGLRFLRRLPAALRVRVSHDQALARVHERLARRQDDFLRLLRDAIYARPSHPVRKLLDRAGCAYGDVEALVRADGVEGALAALYRAGVYLTADEVAGRRRVVRGSDSFDVDPAELRNPWAVAHLVGNSGGSRSGTATAVALDLDAILDQLPAYRLALAAAGDDGNWVEAVWAPPGSIGLAYGLRAAVGFGRPVERWFSPVDEQAGTGASSYRLALRSARLAGLLAGVRLPLPEYVNAADPTPMIGWLEGVRRRGRTPILSLYPSTAARICSAAAHAGRELSGVWLSLRGEPVTPARVAAVRRVGAHVLSLYGAIECGLIGHSCLRAAAVDEVHVHDDLHAIIQPAGDAAVGGLPADALLVTTLRRSARLILVNACLGDQATLDQGSCGCPLESYGWRTHLRGIHSFEKLTGMGMTFADAEVTPVLDRVLPTRFGGDSTDYQLIEEETGDGGVRLLLIVDPRVGPLDHEAVVDAFLDALASVSPTRRMMTLGWRAAGVVSVDRRLPVAAPSGKIMHFRRADARGAPG